MSRERLTWDVVEQAFGDGIALVLKRHDHPTSTIQPWRLTVTAHGTSEHQGFGSEKAAREAWDDMLFAAGIEERPKEEVTILPPESPEELWATYIMELKFTQGKQPGLTEVLTKFESDPQVRDWIEELTKIGTGERGWAAVSLMAGLNEFRSEALAAKAAEEAKALESLRAMPNFGRFA